MLIGETADEIGINPKTVRYYESIGLIPEAERTDAGYRDYGPEDVERLRFIRAGQRLGLSLDDIREVLAVRERGEQPCTYVVEVVRRRTEEIDRQVRELLALRDELTDLLARADDTPPAGASYCHLLETGDARSHDG